MYGLTTRGTCVHGTILWKIIAIILMAGRTGRPRPKGCKLSVRPFRKIMFIIRVPVPAQAGHGQKDVNCQCDLLKHCSYHSIL